MARLEVITGPMFSGKSEELLRRLRRAAYAGKKILLLKPKMDNRNSRNIFNFIKEDKKLAKYDKLAMQAIGSADDFKDSDKLLGYDVIAVDEAQFFAKILEDILVNILTKNCSIDFAIIVCGLDMDFKKEPFGIMPGLMARADNVLKLTAICLHCQGKNGLAIFTQKKSASSGQQVEVGDEDLYEARCRICHYIPNSPA